MFASRFRSEGFFVFENGLADDGLRELQRLSALHEAEAVPTIAGRTWGECQLEDVVHLRAMEIVTPALARAIEDIGFAKPWPVLASDFAHPQLTYSFQTTSFEASSSDLALGQHTDGAPKSAVGVAQPEFLLGVLLNDVFSREAGPYVYWPGSHAIARDHLEQSRDSILLDRVRSIPFADGAPSLLFGRAGDVIVAHRLLRHGTAARTAEGVRRMAFFRLGNEFLPVGARVCETSFSWL